MNILISNSGPIIKGIFFSKHKLISQTFTWLKISLASEPTYHINEIVLNFELAGVGWGLFHTLSHRSTHEQLKNTLNYENQYCVATCLAS